MFVARFNVTIAVPSEKCLLGFTEDVKARVRKALADESVKNAVANSFDDMSADEMAFEVEYDSSEHI